MTTESTPASSGAKCPVCSAFVGPLRVCPTCGARMRQRVSLRVFRWISILLATVGLGLMWLAASHKEIPVVTVGAIQPTMNFAYVRVKGTVPSDARIFREGDDRIREIRFSVDDGTGTMDIRVARRPALQMAQADRIPRAGDHVDVAGSLNVSAEAVSLRLQAAEQLTLDRPAAEAIPVCPLASIGLSDSGKIVRVEALIVSVSAPRAGTRAPWKIRLKEDGGEADAVCFDEVYKSLPDSSLLTPGSLLKGSVRIGAYRGVLQIEVLRGAQVETAPAEPVPAVTPEPPPAAPAVPVAPSAASADPVAPKVEPVPVRPLSSIGLTDSGKIVRVEARIVSVGEPRPGSRAPWKIHLKDDGGEVDAVCFDAVHKSLSDASALAPGVLLKGSARVGAYRGALQIEILRGVLLEAPPAEPVPAVAPVAPVAPPAAPVEPVVEMTEPVAPPAESVERMALTDVTASMTGRVVCVQGRLGAPRSLRAGIAFPLTEGAATIQVVFWDRFIPVAQRDAFREGVRVEVSGRVNVFKDRLEIVPQRPDQVAVKPEPVP